MKLGSLASFAAGLVISLLLTPSASAETFDQAKPMFDGKWMSFDKFSALSPPYFQPRFLAAERASVSSINSEHVKLDHGDVLVRATLPVFVSTTVNGEKIMVRVSNNALVLVSSKDGATRVLPLTEICCSAVLVYVPQDPKHKQNSMLMHTGDIAEVLPHDTPSTVARMLTGTALRHGSAGEKCDVVFGPCDSSSAARDLGVLKTISTMDENFAPSIRKILHATDETNTIPNSHSF